jgi:hypothetical protein
MKGHESVVMPRLGGFVLMKGHEGLDVGILFVGLNLEV